MLVMRPSFYRIKDDIKHDNLIGVEIGVQGADNAGHILSGLGTRLKTLHLIDPYIRDKEFVQGVLKRAKERIKLYESRVVWHIDTSYSVSKLFDDEYFDFVYIDGEHTYDAVKSDIEVYFPKVKTGGFICGHDYRLDNKMVGIRQAVDAWKLNNNFEIGFESHDWWYRK